MAGWARPLRGVHPVRQLVVAVAGAVEVAVTLGRYLNGGHTTILSAVSRQACLLAWMSWCPSRSVPPRLGWKYGLMTVRPTFRDAYLVEVDGSPVGFVRREGSVWRIFRLGVELGRQPRDAYASREEAGARLVEISGKG
jgi:hypothetical protein